MVGNHRLRLAMGAAVGLSGSAGARTMRVGIWGVLEYPPKQACERETLGCCGADQDREVSSCAAAPVCSACGRISHSGAAAHSWMRGPHLDGFTERDEVGSSLLFHPSSCGVLQPGNTGADTLHSQLIEGVLQFASVSSSRPPGVTRVVASRAGWIECHGASVDVLAGLQPVRAGGGSGVDTAMSWLP